MDIERISNTLLRIPAVPITVLVLGYLGYDHYGFENFEDSMYRQRRNQETALIAENKKLVQDIADAEEFFKRLEQKRAELRSLAQRLDDMRATLTEDLDVPALIKRLVTESRKVGLTVKSIRPAAAKMHQYYEEQGFDVSFSGVFVQLLVFLQSLATAERIIRIENLTASRTGSSVAQYVQLDGKVQVKVYRYVGGREDDVAKAGGSANLPPAAPVKPGGAVK